MLLLEEYHVELLLWQAIHLVGGSLLLCGHIGEALLKVERRLRHLLVHALLHLLHLLILHLLIQLELLLHLLVMNIGSFGIIEQVRAIISVVVLSILLLLLRAVIERPHLRLIV